MLALCTPASFPESAAEYTLQEGGEPDLTPLDFDDVSVDIGDESFAEHGIAPRQILADLTDSEYEDLFVTPGATTSSPVRDGFLTGMNRRLTTVALTGSRTFWDMARPRWRGSRS